MTPVYSMGPEEQMTNVDFARMEFAFSQHLGPTTSWRRS